MASFYGDLASQAGSDNESEVSDVDPAEMAKMLEGIDDLDADLFSSTLKKQGGKSSGSLTTQAKSALKSPDSAEKQSKSRVKFGSPDKDKKHAGKSVNFNDFDVDDPLADLLSDDDSVEQKKTKRSVPARQELSASSQGMGKGGTGKEKAQKAKVIADLFGLEDANEEVGTLPSPSKAKGGDDVPGPRSKPQPVEPEPTNLRINPSLTKQKSEELVSSRTTKPTSGASRRKSEGVKFEDDDILDSMGFDSDRKSGRGDFMSGKSNQARPKSVMDELLGKRSSEKEEEFSVKEFEVKKSVSKPEITQDSGVSFGSYSPTISMSRETRRVSSRRNTSAIGDPLGLFSPPATPQRNPVQESIGNKYEFQAPVVKARSAANSDWLGLSGGNKEDRFQPSRSTSPVHKNSVVNEAITSVAMETSSRSRNTARTNPEPPQRNSGIAESSDLPDWLGGGGGGVKNKPAAAVNTPMHYQSSVAEPLQPPSPPVHQDNTIKVDQGPVSELLANSQLEQQVVLALQRQEAALLAAAGLRAHEAKLGEVQRRQQTLLEQQEAQLRQLVEHQVERQHKLEEQLRAQQERISIHVQALLTQPPGLPILESPVVPPTPLPVLAPPLPEPVPAPAEPLNKEELAEAQASLQKCELQKMYLEAKLESLESKHKEEVHLLEECYTRQMSILEEALEKQEARLRAENHRLEVDYKEHILRMQEQYAQLIEEHGKQLAALQQERLADLQQLRQQQEAMLQHVRQAQKAEAMAVRDASEHMTSLQTTVEMLGRSAGGLGELQGRLEQQQRSQNDAREATLRAREAELQAQRESFERQCQVAEEEDRQRKELAKMVAKQRQELEEKNRRLSQDAERLNKEREQFESDRQQLEKLKRSLLEEQKLTRQQLDEDRVSLAAEKSRLETIARLQTSPPRQDGTMQLQAEAEAALAVAREAADRAQLERSSLKEQQRRLDSERRRLTELELDLTVRAREVEGLAQIATATRNEGVQALAEAARAERMQAQREAELQQQLSDLHEREQRLVQEKLSLSQERLTLRKSREQRQSPEHSLAPSVLLQDKFVDPKVVILKLVAEKEREALENNWSSLRSISK